MIKHFFTKTDTTEIGYIKNHVVNILLAIYLVFTVPLLFLSLRRSVLTGWSYVYSLQIMLVFCYWLVFIFRKKLHYKFKAVFTGILLLILFASGLHQFGLLSSGLVFLLLFAVFSSLFIGITYGYIALVIAAGVFVVYGVLYNMGFKNYRFDIELMFKSKSLWFAVGLTFLVASYSIVFIIDRLEKAYKTLLVKSKKSEDEYKLLFDQANEGVIIASLKGDILLVNENFRIMSGFNNADILGENLQQLIVPDENSNEPIKLDKLARGETVTSERRVFDKWGKIRHIKIKGNMLPDRRLQLLIRDISEQKKFEKEIEAEREFGKTLVEAMPGVFYVFENYEKLVQWNESLLLLSGYSVDEIQKIHPNNLFDNGNYDNDGGGITQSGNKGSAYFRADLITKSGDRIPLYNSAINYTRDKKIYLMGVGYDISDLILAENALKNSEINFRNIYNNTSDAIFIYNHDFKILSANDRFYTLTGLSPDDLNKINFFDFIFDQNTLQNVASEVNQIDKGRVVIAEYVLKDKKGKKFPIEVRSRPIIYEGKNAVVTSFNDISARKDLEKQVYTVSVKAEEDERGRIAKDLHDGLGPLLSTCKIYLHNLKSASLSEKETRSFTKLTELINESLTGVKEISNNLSPHILRNFGVEHALHSFIEKFTAYNEIEISANLKASNRYNEIIEITLYRVITELLNNTLKHAMAKHVSISMIENDGKIIVDYHDDGLGFDYSKMIQEKKGLGLFNIVSRINSVGGVISFKSEKEKGVYVNIEISA